MGLSLKLIENPEIQQKEEVKWAFAESCDRHLLELYNQISFFFFLTIIKAALMELVQAKWNFLM